MAGTFHYFAYGSNMLSERLAERCHGAEPFGVAVAKGHTLHFGKRGIKDGSGKATLEKSSRIEDQVFGVIFEIDIDHRAALDRAEGGYQRDDYFVVYDSATDEQHTVTTYLARSSECDRQLRPFDWYRAFLLAGAEQHQLPRDYVRRLRAVDAQKDTSLDRPDRRSALALLRKAGFGAVATECE